MSLIDASSALHAALGPTGGRCLLAPAGGVRAGNAAAYMAAGADLLVSSAPSAAPPRDVQVSFEELPALSECLTAWRLRDGGWVVHRSVRRWNGCAPTEWNWYSVRDAMPR